MKFARGHRPASVRCRGNDCSVQTESEPRQIRTKGCNNFRGGIGQPRNPIGNCSKARSQMRFIDALAQPQIQRLPRLLRVMLISDGNLTEMLQAAFLEPIVVTKLQNKASRTCQEIEELQLSTGSKIVSRQVKLSGSLSRHLYVYAETILAADRTPSEFLSELQNTEKPLGYLLRENDLCGRKELISAEWVPENTEEPMCAASIKRRYVVVHKQLPIALISEHFKCCQFDCGLSDSGTTPSREATPINSNINCVSPAGL